MRHLSLWLMTSLLLGVMSFADETTVFSKKASPGVSNHQSPITVFGDTSGTATSRSAGSTVMKNRADMRSSSLDPASMARPESDSGGAISGVEVKAQSVPLTETQQLINDLARQHKELMLAGRVKEAGSFEAQIRDLQNPPPRREGNPLDQGNDYCPATVISNIPYTDTGTTAGYGNDYTPQCASSSAPDLVYQYTCVTTGSHTVSLCGSGYDTVLEIRYFGGCPGQIVLACNDDYCGLQSQSTATLTAGTTYWFIVDGYGANSGSYTINVTGPAPANPDVCPGFTITSLPYSDTQNTGLMGNEYTPACGSSSAPDAIYTFTPSTSGVHTISLCSYNGFDTILDVRTGGSCPGSTSVACNDDYCGVQSQVTPNLTAGVTYYILVDGYSTYSGIYTLTVTGPQPTPGDNCSNPIIISSVPYSYSGSTVGLSNDYTPACGSSSAPDVVFQFQPSVSNWYTMSLCGSSFNTILDVRTGGSCPGNTYVTCNDDFCGQQSQVSYYLSSANAYYIFVDGSSTSSGNYVLTVNLGGAPGDNCSNPFVIPGVPYTDDGSTTGMTNDYAISCVPYNTAPDVIYRFTPTVTQNYVASLCGSTFNTTLSITTDEPCPGIIVVACNDDYCGLQSQLETVLNAGTTYYFIVDGAGTESGSYHFHLEANPPGERCSNALPASVPMSATGSTCNFANNYDYACPWSSTSNDVIYSYTPVSNQRVSLSLCRSDYDTKLYVYQNSCSGTPIACNDDAAPCPCAGGAYRSYIDCLQLYAGNTYFFVVDGYGGGCGNYVLITTECPACDVTQQTGDIVETPEDCSDPNYVLNDPDGGCNSTPPQYSTIQNGQTVFGRVHTYSYNGTTYRDTDFYQFTLTEPNLVQIVCWGTELPLLVSIVSPDTCASFPYYYTFPGACSSPAYLTTPCMPAGTYAMAVAPHPIPPPTAFTFDYRVQISWSTCAPPNDNCANAIPLIVNASSSTCGTTIGSTRDCSQTPQQFSGEVWYTFTLNQCTDVSVEYCGSQVAGVLYNQVFAGSCCGSAHSLLEGSECADGRPILRWGGLLPGQYWLPVALDPPQPFCIRVVGTPGPPANDQCANATVLTVDGGAIFGSTTCATTDNAPVCGGAQTAPGVWYKVTGTGDSLGVSTCDTRTSYDTRISVFECGCSSLTCLAANDDDPGSCGYNPIASTARWCSAAGQDYWILVHGYQAAAGNFAIYAYRIGSGCSTPAACPPPNDNCANAIPLTVNDPNSTCGTTAGATLDCPGIEPHPEVWYTFNLQQCANVTISFCGSANPDTLWPEVFGGSCCGQTEPVFGWALNECANGAATWHYWLSAGQHWFPVRQNPPGPFCVRVTAVFGPPANDLAANALTLPLNAWFHGSTLCATVDVVPACPDPPTSPGVWYQVTGNGDRLYVSTCDFTTQFDTRLSVFACNTGTCIASNDNNPGCTQYPLTSSVGWCSVPGETYQILVHGTGNQAGKFLIQTSDSGQACSTSPPCCASLTLNAPGSITGTTVGMGNDCSLWAGQDVVVKVTIPTPGSWSFSLCGSDPALFPYVGTECCNSYVRWGDWVTCTSGQIGAVAWCADIGQPGTYYCTIDDTIPGAGGAYTLTVFEDVPPSQVTGVAASDTLCNGIDVTWNDTPDENYYYIYRDTIEVTRVNANVNTFFDNTTGTHSYRVLSATWCYVGPFSLPEQGTCLTSPPQAVLVSPLNGATVMSGALQDYCWQSVSGAISYRIEWDDDPAFGSPLQAASIALCYTQTLSAPLGTWYWHVAGVNACGLGSWSTPWTIQLITLSPPVLVVNMNVGVLRLAWSHVNGATSYRVEFADMPDGPFSLLTTTPDTTITQPPNLSAKRFYQVIAQAGASAD